MAFRKTRRATEEAEARIGWRMAGLGFHVASEVAAGALLGWLFDLYAGTGSKGLLTGAIIGITVGLLSLVRGAWAMNKVLSADEARRSASRAANRNDHDDDDRDDR